MLLFESVGRLDSKTDISVPDHASVDAFHEAAVAAGGKDNGGPGARPHYHPHYYGAFVFDPVGNNIETVNRTAP
jgi:hypothetical protein